MGMKIATLIWIGWGVLWSASLLWFGQAFLWISAMVLPVAKGGFVWGAQGALGLAALSSLSGLFLVSLGYPAIWLAGPWSVFGLLPLLLWRREYEFRAQTLGCEQRQQLLGSRWTQLRKERDEWCSAIRKREDAIQQIHQQYGLSRQFLATLDLDQAVQITEEVLAREWPLMTPEGRALLLRAVRSLVEEGKASSDVLMQGLDVTGADPDSHERWGIVSGQLALGLRRISLYRQVQEAAIHDGLTGLLVRRHFRERLEEEVNRALRRGSSLVFLMVDLDHFKQVNDTYGHLVGDVVLREVASLIHRAVREIDLVGRYGGEEFAVVLPESGRTFGIQIAERIRQTVEQASLRAYDEQVHMTVPIGVALCPEDASVADHLIDKADQAMYRAKALGRNRVVSLTT
jgi:diguanylate cyclase (GGDEF)-like protein